jgi:hypothetical protein
MPVIAAPTHTLLLLKQVLMGRGVVVTVVST